MGIDNRAWGNGPRDEDVPDEEWEWDRYGPLTDEDDIWFLDRVISKGYPALQRGERQFDGQSSIYDFIDDEIEVVHHAEQD